MCCHLDGLGNATNFWEGLGWETRVGKYISCFDNMTKTCNRKAVDVFIFIIII